MTVTVNMTCVPNPLTKEEYGNTSISGGIANGLFTAGPDTIRWTADDVPTSPMALPLDMTITLPTEFQPGSTNSIETYLSQDFGAMATDTWVNTIIPQLPGPPTPVYPRSFFMVFGSSNPRLGFFIQPPAGTTFDETSLSLLQTPDHTNAVSHGVPALTTTGMTSATGAAETNSPSLLQVEVADEFDLLNTQVVNFTNKGDRTPATGYVVEPQWTDPGSPNPTNPQLPNPILDRTESDPWDVTATVDLNVPAGLAGTNVEFKPVTAPVDFNLGLWPFVTLGATTGYTTGRVNFDWSCTADDPNQVLLSVPVAAASNTVSGTVVEDGTGNPLEGISVRLNDAVTNVTVDKVPTDASGNYSFADVADGNYIVRFVDLDGLHTPEFNLNQATRLTADTVTVAGASVDVDASLAPDGIGNIRGVVTEDGSGTPLAGVSVRLLADDGTTLLATRTTKADGSYAFDSKAFGNYKVRFIDTDMSHIGEFNLDAPTRFTAATVVHGALMTTVNAGLAASV